MTAPYLLISDTHLHAWTAFAKTNPDGVNSRLQEIIDAHHTAATSAKLAGAKMLFNAGDTFHVRGEIAPSVLNPAMDLYRDLCAEFAVHMIPGNHDLEGNGSARISNAITSLESVGANVAHEPAAYYVDSDWMVVMFPWYASTADLLKAMKGIRADYGTVTRLDAIIHAPVDNVLPHLPDHGLTADMLADVGFHRVFSGHYHHHKDLGRGIYSIGALTHQTFGDIDSKAGYLLVYPDRVEHFESAAPKFVEVTGEETESELAEKIKGNYVRCRLEVSSDKELQEIRDGLTLLGAAGVVVMPIKKVVVTRSGATTTSGSSIENSIKDFATKRGMSAEVQALCADILTEARAAE